MDAGISQINRLFVSYAHADNKLFDDAVKYFTEDLKGFYAAKTGNHLSVFFDRESINWGGGWRSQIDGELRNATIFMPIITMQYFNRPACRDELNAFNESAKRLGNQYLILPVVIAGASSIRADHPIPEVATIEALQYRNLEDSFLAGRGSSEWRRALSSLTDELISAISRAELAVPEGTSTGDSNADSGDAFDDDSDFLTNMAELGELIPALEQEVAQVLGDLTSWTEVVKENSTRIKPGLTPQQVQAISMGIAEQFKKPSDRLHDSGVKFAATVEKADAVMSSVRQQISLLPSDEERESLRRLIRGSQDPADLVEAASGMGELLQSMVSVEVMSAPLRKALKPARIGISKIQDAIRVVDRWGKEI
ncbi:toll/interleukin-1 receptor domain-containing protein [Streptomyces sp. P11-1]|uniref:toll/interleukin-1 receptor domain-containing protein n=1 Tax=Streptomyces sp. P11-1 TaxID=3423221 RepID=UPI003D2F5122